MTVDFIKIDKMFDRKRQLRWASIKVGLLISATLAIVLFVIIFSGGIQSLIQKQEEIKIAISDVKGLRKGAPVRVAGVDVGQVLDIKLDKKYGTIVSVSIQSYILDYLREDAKATVQTLGLLGDKYIEIIPGESAKPYDRASIMFGYPQTEIKDIVSVATSTIGRIDRLIQELDTFITEIRDSRGTLSRLVKDPTLYDNLNTAVLELKKTVSEVREGSLGMISRDKELYERFSRTLKNIEETSDKLSSNQGSLGKLINEPELYENLVKVSKRLDSLLSEIDSSQGTLALLIRDRKMAEDLRESVRELKELIEEIKRNPRKFFKFSVF